MVRAARIHSAVVKGVEALPVTVEVSITPGIPGINIVGMASSSVLESRHRIRCAFKACGFELPRSNITVNLVPADLIKTGTGFDLPIALGILKATHQVSEERLKGGLFVGELGLLGEMEPVKGALAYGVCAQNQQKILCGPFEQSELSALHISLKRYSSLMDFCAKQDVTHAPDALDAPSAERKSRIEEVLTAEESAEEDLDFSDVIDQDMPKRALTIAAAGNLGALMVGPPGAGKTMLAKRLPTILDSLTDEERIQSAIIHSVAGLSYAGILKGKRPFQAPHHSITPVALAGGGRPVVPGIISLAHNGVLFLDELPEFSSQALQILRQPIEEGCVRITRSEGSFVFPARFLLLAAANPCPCGYLGDDRHDCRCSATRINHYQTKMGGPLADRIELIVDVARPKAEKIIKGQKDLSSTQMRNSVLAAKEFAQWRQDTCGVHRHPRKTQLSTTAQFATSTTQLDTSHSAKGAFRALLFSEEASKALEQVAAALALGGRSLMSVARVARVIADIEQRLHIEADDIFEASLFRPRAEEGDRRAA